MRDWGMGGEGRGWGVMIYDRYESDGWVGGVLYPFCWFFFGTGWWASVAFLLLGLVFRDSLSMRDS